MRVLLTFDGPAEPSKLRAPEWSILNKGLPLKSNLRGWLDQLHLANGWSERYEAIKQAKFVAELDGKTVDVSKVQNGCLITIKRSSQQRKASAVVIMLQDDEEDKREGPKLQ